MVRGGRRAGGAGVSLLDGGEDGLGERRGRVVVARRVAVRLGDGEPRALAVVEDGRPALAAARAEGPDGPGVRHLHVHGLGEGPARVRHHGDHGLEADALVLGPRVHDGHVVHAVNDDLVDPRGFQLGLLGQVPGDLLRGSGGRERARKTDDDGLLAGEALRQADRGVGEVRHQDAVGRDAVADGDVAHHAATAQGRARGEDRLHVRLEKHF
mmetsp:Transcript_22866/g.68644  ORF Transcript_22866/g.68644 Transcript_22866/m.68644 type:complete len:212 (-) Transcript_22866:85-720(-)